MSFNYTKQDLISEFKRYLEWEQMPFENWESVEIFIGETLSEAWLSARPNDKFKFKNVEFKRMIDGANGKWLEKQNEDDTYKIILSTKHCNSIHGLTKRLVHEMRHCLDFQKAVEGLAFEDYHPGNSYFINWSEFRAVYAHTRYEYFCRAEADMGINRNFEILAEILGKNSADATVGLMRSKGDMHDTLYFISRYIGASRAIRNLNMELQLNVPVFHLWHMAPHYITEKYGYVFYIGNEWDDTKVCGLDDSPQTYYYNKLLETIKLNIAKQNQD